MCGNCSLRGSELPACNKDRKYIARFVYGGSEGSVRGEYNSIALFEDIGSSPATLEPSKIVDADGLPKGDEQQCAEAEQAYTQAHLRGPTCWVSLPREY